MRLTHKRLLELLRYNPRTGVFRWKLTKSATAIAAEQAGNIYPSNQRRRITIDGRKYWSGRLAFFYMTGKWPSQVDHKNRNRADDRWSNLRGATGSQNQWNSGRRRNKLPKGVIKSRTRFSA